jgi:hypothetical protein
VKLRAAHTYRAARRNATRDAKVLPQWRKSGMAVWQHGLVRFLPATVKRPGEE